MLHCWLKTQEDTASTVVLCSQASVHMVRGKDLGVTRHDQSSSFLDILYHVIITMANLS